MKQKISVICDLDDTLADLKTPMLDALNKLTGKTLKSEDLTKFDIVSLYGISDQDFFDCLINEKILENLEPFPETKDLLTDLVKKDYNVTIITSRAYHPNALQVTARWFNKYDIPFSRLIISDHGKKKCDYLNEEENVALFVDDKVENCEDFIASKKSKFVRLYDAPWNQHSPITRVTDLLQVRKLLKM